MKKKKFFIKTFGCIQNTIDSDQIRQIYIMQGCEEVDNYKKSNICIINSCVVRESAENRVYGLINEVKKYSKRNKKKIEIVVMGCLTGWANRNKRKKRSLDRQSLVDVSFLSLPKLVDDNQIVPVLNGTGLISISCGCNNFCSYCIVPVARGPEKSVNFESIIKQAKQLRSRQMGNVLLVGQNVNSYGADLVGGKNRTSPLFPHLLEEVAKLGFKKVSFVSSNPWDFSDELIGVIARNKNVDRLVHLPIQSGSDQILVKMNRSYTIDEYCNLVKKLRQQIIGLKISTDIIIGFPGETDEIFERSFKVYKKIGFDLAYLNKYSPRSGTLSERMYKDDVDPCVKKARWRRLDMLINK